MKTKYIIASISFIAFMIMGSALFVTQVGTGNEETRATSVTYTVQSAHNYANNFDYTWTVTKSGATSMRPYFYRLSTETNYDYVYLYDKAGTLKATYTGNKGYNWWGPTIAGDTFKVRLKTDSSVTSYGFKITKYEYVAGTTTDTTPPTISITSPTNGATVSGTVSVAVTKSDNVGVTSTLLSIDSGAYFTCTYPYSWNTASLSNGAHTLKAQAKDAAGNIGYSSLVSVTVSNTAPPPQDGDDHFLGAVAGGETDWYSIYAYSGGAAISVSVSWSGSYDIDCYICTSQSTSTYLARGYTTANPETCSYTPTSSGTYYIGVKMYTSSAPSTNYDCHVTYEATAPPPPPPPTGNNYAVIVGISDYKAINDLSYCDEDATDWYNYLKNTMQYPTSNMRVLGDGHTSNYPAYYAVATEANYRSCLTWVKDNIASGNTFVFATSGHGSGTGTGSSYLCAWDCGSGESGYDGNFYDTEIDDYTEAIAAKGANVLVFIDHCYSGGIGPELTATAHASKVLVLTTCTQNGYGYDDSSHHNGAWTYWFLEAGLIAHYGSSTTTAMETCFTWADGVYPYTGGDNPMKFDGNTGSLFYL
jgi:hypothetical protein